MELVTVACLLLVTRPAPAEAAVNRLRDALAARGVSVASCNRERDDPGSLNLCGLTNVQGRLSNGSRDPCRVVAPRASGRFLHIEQRRSIREEPRPLIEALMGVFPAPGVRGMAVKQVRRALREEQI